jgi:tRNA modification GTPase
MYSTDDTIVAISTPAGRGAIGVVRLSGPDAQRIAGLLLGRSVALRPRYATFGIVRAGEQRDQVIATSFPGPASYTGDDVVEISAHGSGVVLRAIVHAAVSAGARLAEPGEFTLRAYVNGRIDLPQAEAVADLIDAVTPLQARAAFDQLNGTITSRIAAIDAELFDVAARLEASVDFPDEGYHFIDRRSVASALGGVIDHVDELLRSSRRGRLVREGAQVTIVGRPNAGKSSLFNALVGSHRAIVTDVPGTTRDLLTEVVDLEGVRVTLVDTAGLRESSAPVEREGIDRARRALETSELTLLVCDSSSPWSDDDSDIASQISDRKRVVVASKSDLPPAWRRDDAVRVSAKTGDGIQELVARVVWSLDLSLGAEPPALTNLRHIQLLSHARSSLERAREAAAAEGGGMSEEFVLADLAEARRALEDIAGRRGADDLLAHVFQNFCIGK